MTSKSILFAIILMLSLEARTQALSQRDINRMFIDQATEEPVLKDMAQALPQKLINAGVLKVGSVELAKLSQKINSITFRANDSFIATQFGTRTSALYEPASKTLVVNATVSPWIGYAITNNKSIDPAILAERVEPLVLHEALGASGINDKKYDTSLGAYFLSNSTDLHLKNKIQSHLEKSGGGTTNVGGGGNDMSLWIKLKLLQSSLTSNQLPLCQSVASHDLFMRILDTNIEGSFACDSMQLNYDIRSRQILHCQASAWWLSTDADQLNASFGNFLNQFCTAIKQGG